MFVTFRDVTEVRPNMIQLPAKSIVVWTKVRVESRYRREKGFLVDVECHERNLRNTDSDHDRNLLFLLNILLSVLNVHRSHREYVLEHH